MVLALHISIAKKFHKSHSTLSITKFSTLVLLIGHFFSQNHCNPFDRIPLSNLQVLRFSFSLQHLHCKLQTIYRSLLLHPQAVRKLHVHRREKRGGIENVYLVVRMNIRWEGWGRAAILNLCGDNCSTSVHYVAGFQKDVWKAGACRCYTLAAIVCF